MNGEISCVYGFEYPARTLTSLASESDDITFFIGTQSLRQKNKVFKIDYDEENNLITPIIYNHDVGEIWHISSSPFDKDLLGTCYNQILENDITFNVSSIWRLQENIKYNEDSSEQSSSNLLHLTSIRNPNESNQNLETICMIWHPSGSTSQVITLSYDSIYLWDLNVSDSSTKLIASTIVESKSPPEIKTGRWNSNLDYNQMATVNGVYVRGWDLRTMKQTFLLDAGPNNTLRNVDFNANRSHVLATCGDDAKIRFWDARKPGSDPLLTLCDHTHWIWSVRFNPFHDQLVLSSGSDARVMLTRVASISSEAVLLLNNDQSSPSDNKSGNPPTTQDCVVKKFDEEHEDSVYASEWSASDPWHFASLSYDGRFCVNKVPKSEKYRIIL
ncbi:unnamed protein product [Gordionus sp. m RMFG-2023]